MNFMEIREMSNKTDFHGAACRFDAAANVTPGLDKKCTHGFSGSCAVAEEIQLSNTHRH